MSDIDFRIPEHMRGLVQTFTEMMTGESSQQRVEMVIQWALYMHMRSVMPPLIAHWNQSNPAESALVKQAIKELQTLNQQWKEQRQSKQATGDSDTQDNVD